MTYTCEYDDTGGYDCMTAAYHIKLNGIKKVAVDLGDFGQEWNEPPTPETLTAAKRIADIILAALNAAPVP